MFLHDDEYIINRRTLEKQAGLKPKAYPDYKGHVLLVVALVTGLIGGFTLDRLYRQPEAQAGHILAKSEITKREIKALNIAPAKSEKVSNGR